MPRPPTPLSLRYTSVVSPSGLLSVLNPCRRYLVLRKIADALNINTDYLLYENRADIRIQNIELLLQKQSHNFAATVEQMVRVLINGFSDDS